MRRIIALLTAASVLGCSSGKPKAPALSDDPVYRNSRAGFRFVAPEGWTQFASAELPSGPLEKEWLLVQYRGQSGDLPASLEVSCADIPESTSLEKYLAGGSHSIPKWKPAGPPTQFSAHDVSAMRYAYQGSQSSKEVVAFRRGGRVFFFTLLCGDKDTRSRDQARKAVASVIWD